MSFYVYVLYSQSKNQFYKGQTNNINERLKRHNQAKEKSTQSGIPWILLWYTSKPSRAKAILLEKKLKNLSRKRTIEFLLKYREDIVSPDELKFLLQLSEY